MRFNFHSSASCSDGTPQSERYLQVIDEVVLAEEMGFDAMSFGEQHFNTDHVTQVSSPEVMSGWVASRTSKIRLRWASAILLGFNHPLRTAERLATLDVLSGGRAELCTARSNHAPTLAAFEIPPDETRAQWSEAFELIVAALTEDEFEHHGQFWDVPSTSLVPRPLQQPHPPLFYASTSKDGLRIAAEKGLGALSGNSLPGGWSYVEECARLYKETVAHAEPLGAYVNDCLCSSVITAHCAESMEQALAEAAIPGLGFVNMVIEMFTGLSESAPDYRYMGEIERIRDHAQDMRYLNERAPYISVGTPDFLIERFRQMEQMGYDEVILRIDGMGHEVNMRSIEMFGKHVIPAFRTE